ncbi:MAG: hypothetical protein F9K18_12770 [Thermoanaerobaculia bacterium]|nr:MAG: hypothetical protein F9K18_12770 [Thermoanaerobaculia bacterium]
MLMVLAALYYAFLAIWSGSSPPHVVAGIAALAPYWLVYALLLVNTAVCLWRRLPALRRELERDRRSGARALGTFFFHGAFFLVASGFLLTLAGRQEAKVWVALGEEYTARPDQILSQSAPRALAGGVPPLAFRLERLAPEFWGDELLFTRYEAALVFPDGRARTTRINRPLWLGPATFLRLSGYGFAPRYELVNADGLRIDSAFVKLNVFPPGQRDSFSVPGLPHRITVELYPDLDFEDGAPVTRSLVLARPGVAVDVARGRIALGGAVLRAGETFGYEGLRLGFPEVRPWAELTEVWDPGAPVLLAGYLLGLAGLVLKVALRPRPGAAAVETAA